MKGENKAERGEGEREAGGGSKARRESKDMEGDDIQIAYINVNRSTVTI